MTGAAARAKKRPLFLVVDDEPSIVAAFTTILRHEGYDTISARSAEAALHLLNGALPPDAVLLDLRMPGIGGLGFLLALQEYPAAKKVPVAVITGESQLDPATALAVAALDAHVCFKPVNIEELAALARRLLRNRPHRAPTTGR